MSSKKDWQGFWSYVHADDEAEGSRISQLARDVAEQFEMMSGESISLFLDRDAIDWGQNWKERVDSGLGSVAFFIAVMTPRYFMSSECRRELQFFVRKAAALGMSDLVLALHYADVPQLGKAESSDELVNLVRSFQWEDWRDLRFSDRSSEPYRRGVARLAVRLIEANRRQPGTPETIDTLPSAANTMKDCADEPPGLIDLLANAEEALPKATDAMALISTEIEAVGQVMRGGAEEIRNGDSHGKGFAVRLLVARKLVHRLKDPVERIETSANAFASQLHDVDQGFRIMIDQAPDTIRADPESKINVCGFFATIRSTSTSAHASFASVKQMIDSIEPIEKMSRDLRPTLRRLRQALTVMLEGTEVIDEWVALIDASGVDCGGCEPEAETPQL